MDQLMQFISASLTDMTRGDRHLTTTNTSSTASSHNSGTIATAAAASKPYKCALLDDSSRASRLLTPPSSDASASSAAAAGVVSMATAAATGHHACAKHEESNKDIVQQSQVSSTRSPSVLANDIIGPLLLEALDGFLFMVDNMGKIQFISENVTQYLKYTKDDLIGNKIYNLVHGEDYSHFTKSLELLSKESTSKSKTFSCRMNVKPPGDEREPCYDNMQITAILQPHPGDADSDKSSRCLLACIARRVGCVEKSTTSLGIEKFTTKQDLKGKILACDTSGGLKPGSQSYSKLIGENVQDFCHGNDRQQLLKHHREVIMNGSNTSGVYRFRLHESRYVFVQTKSKLFKNPMNGNPEFIMSTHSIVRECDTESELKGSASSCLMKAIIGNSGSKLSKDRLDLGGAKSRHQGAASSSSSSSAASTHPQSTIFDLEDLFSDPRLDFASLADDASFCDIPDLLPNSTQWPSLSDLDRGLSSCPGSPAGSIPALSPATSASRSPRGAVSSAGAQQGWLPKECRPAKQGRGRPRSSKRAAVACERVPSWMPPCTSTMGGMGMGGGQGRFNVPVVSSQQEAKAKRNLVNSRSLGGYSSAGPSLTDSWESLYSPPTSVDHFPSLSSSKKPSTGFAEVNLIQQMRQLQQATRQRSISGSSSTSTSWMDKQLTPTISGGGGNKNAHLLDLLLRDDDEEDDPGASLLSSPGIHRSGLASIKSELSDSETGGRTQSRLPQPGEEAKAAAAALSAVLLPGKKPAMQNVILKHLLSQVDEDSQPFKCELKLVPAESGAGQADPASSRDLDSVDSSAARGSVPPMDVSNSNVSNEAEPKKEDDVLLKQLLNKDEESFTPSRSSSPALLKSLLSNDDTSAQNAESRTGETEVASSGLSSPMEVSFPYHLSEFLTGGVKRKVAEIDEATTGHLFKLPTRSENGQSGGCGDARGSKRKAAGPTTGPSKKNILLAQLLSKEVENDPMVGVKNPSAIATVTPLMQMLQQSGGKTDEGATQGHREGQDPEADDPGAAAAATEGQQRVLTVGPAAGDEGSCPREASSLAMDDGCLKEEDWADYGIGDLSPADKADDDSMLKEFIRVTKTETEEEERTEEATSIRRREVASTAGEDAERTDAGSPSEEDKKILAELEEVLESSRFTMEDLNSMLGISSGMVLDPAGNATKSAINALEEQVSRIDSDLRLQGGGVDDRDGTGLDRGRSSMQGVHGWPGNDVSDLGMLGDFEELVGPGGQRCSQMMQGCPKRMTESIAPQSFNMFDPMNRPNLATSMASLPAYQRQASLHQHQLFVQGQQQVNKPSAASEQGVEAANGSREEIFGDYTPISPALQDDVFSPGDPYGYPQLPSTDLLPRSSMNYPGTSMSSLYSHRQGQTCSPKLGPMTPSSRCHSNQMNQFGPYFGGGNLPIQGGMRETGEKKRARFVERMNSSLSSAMNPALSASLADGELGMFANQRSFDVMNQVSWNQMNVGQADGNHMVDQRTVGPFNQTRLNMMSGSRVNEQSKGGSSFYGSNLNSVQQMFKGQMKVGELMNPNQMNLAGQMSMNQMNIGQMNQINVRQMNQINVGQINQINVGQINQINVGQMNQVSMGPGGNQINMSQMNLGHMNMNLGQMNAVNMGQMNHFDRMKRGGGFNTKSAASSPEEFSHPVKTNKEDRMSSSSRSKGHRGHMEFMSGNQGQRMNAAGMMNPTGIGMNYESIGLGMDSGHMGQGEVGVMGPTGVMGPAGVMGQTGVMNQAGAMGQTGVMGQVGSMGQVPHPGHGRMTHSGMGQMGHHGLGHMNQMGGGAPMKGMNRVSHHHPQSMGHPGQAQGHLHRMNLPCQGKPMSSAGFLRPLELPGFGQGTIGQHQVGQSPMGQSAMGQSPMGQSAMGQSAMGQSPLGQSSLNQSAMGQSPMSQSPMGQSQMGQQLIRQSNLERVPRPGMHGLSSSGFESPPELNVEEIFQGKGICDSDQFSGGSMGVQSSVFGDGRQGSYRIGSDRHSLQGQSNAFASEQQHHLSAQTTQDPMLLSPISNHSVSLDGPGTNKNQMSNVCTGNNVGRQAISRDAAKTVQRSLSEMSGVKETSSTREYIKQELRNMCTARAQQGHHSLHQQQMHQQQHQHHHLPQHQHHQQPQSGTSSSYRLGSMPGFDDEIPLDILESTVVNCLVNEITKAQEKQQKLMTHNTNQMTSFEQAMAPRAESKNRDPLLFTGENSHDPLGSDPLGSDPLGSDQFWDPSEGDELTDQIQNPALSFDGIFEQQLDSSRTLPKISTSVRMSNKSGSLLQKLLSDTT